MKYNPQIVKQYFRDMGLPAPVTEYKFASDVRYTDKAGRERTRGWAFDFAFLPNTAKVALEVEGGIFIAGRHSRGAGMKADMKKYNTAASMGWRVLRVTPQELCMQETVELLYKTLGIRNPQKGRPQCPTQ